MLLEVVLYVNQRMAGRVPVVDGEIMAVVENGWRRTPKSKSFDEAVKYLQYETDLEPVGQPEVLDNEGAYRTYRYTYRKPNVYVQKEYDRWACAYPVGEWPDQHWMVIKAGKETRFESKDLAMVAVDAYVGYDYMGDLHRKTVDKSHKTRREQE